MSILYKIFRQDKNSREGVITITSVIGILVNLVIASVKIILGTLAASIAVVSEGMNNATDCLTAVITIAGNKLANKSPDKKHPFGYGRVEYLTGLVISVLILFTGFEFLKESVNLIFHPRKMDMSVFVLIIVAISAVAKLGLGVYTVKKGKSIKSDTLIALGLDSRNDSVISVVTIVSAIIYLAFDFSVDAYAGIFMAFYILKAGVEILRETLGKILGIPADKAFADKLYHEIRSTDGVINAVDMMLHNYGPENYSGSVNIEIDHSKTIGEVYGIIHDLQLKIMHEYGVTMVFGMYAVDNDNPEVAELRKKIAEFVKTGEHTKSYHALYIKPDERKIYCDIIVDYELKNRDTLQREFTELVKSYFPEYDLVLVLETEYV